MKQKKSFIIQINYQMSKVVSLFKTFLANNVKLNLSENKRKIEVEIRNKEAIDNKDYINETKEMRLDFQSHIAPVIADRTKIELESKIANEKPKSNDKNNAGLNFGNVVTKVKDPKIKLKLKETKENNAENKEALKEPKDINNVQIIINENLPSKEVKIKDSTYNNDNKEGTELKVTINMDMNKNITNFNQNEIKINPSVLIKKESVTTTIDKKLEEKKHVKNKRSLDDPNITEKIGQVNNYEEEEIYPDEFNKDYDIKLQESKIEKVSFDHFNDQEDFNINKSNTNININLNNIKENNLIESMDDFYDKDDIFKSKNYKSDYIEKNLYTKQNLDSNIKKTDISYHKIDIKNEIETKKQILLSNEDYEADKSIVNELLNANSKVKKDNEEKQEKDIKIEVKKNLENVNNGNKIELYREEEKVKDGQVVNVELASGLSGANFNVNNDFHVNLNNEVTLQRQESKVNNDKNEEKQLANPKKVRRAFVKLLLLYLFDRLHLKLQISVTTFSIWILQILLKNIPRIYRRLTKSKKLPSKFQKI